MAEMGEGVTGPGTGGDDGHPDDCVFCAESPRELKGYKTKHGMLKDEAELERSLWSNAQEIITDSDVGPIYPLPGGNDPTTGWRARAGALEDFEVEMGAAPHHIIPGKAAMAKSSLERWTRADKGKIKEDIGYSIDCARNGIFLPHIPVIYWTKHKLPERVPMSEYYGKTWKDLSDSSKQSVGFMVMRETWLQMHYTDHRAPYNDHFQGRAGDTTPEGKRARERARKRGSSRGLPERSSFRDDSEGREPWPWKPSWSDSRRAVR